ncbi:MAG: 3'-5' exonuclease domain-containing protein 2 [Cyclobacteriaceae bacterium]|nr:3'-5' exonuclease domain-containing protein 2 [Cyclobacteriaceae bacterium HetDA_MAG_MS6]
MFRTSIPKDRIQHLPLLHFKGKINVVTEEKELKKALNICQKAEYVGFDTEKKPTFHKGHYNPTALVQLSTMESAFLIRLNHLGFHPLLKTFFQESETLKIGISISEDIRELEQMDNFEASGFVDLNNIAQDLGIEDIGVKKLAAIFLEHRISKNQQTSNWENEILTPAQQRYAATDAWICTKIYKTLADKGYV